MAELNEPKKIVNMRERQLEYMLRETATAVLMMHRDKSTLHMFDLGKTPSGQELVFVMAVLTREEAERLGPTKPSDPIPANEPSASNQPPAGGNPA